MVPISPSPSPSPSPRKQSGWLQKMTMGVLRLRLHGLLTLADVHDPYRLMSPSVPEFETACVNVHSKLTLVDDDLLRVELANLNIRSMTKATRGRGRTATQARASVVA
jgi:phospholipase D1/2